MNCPLCHTVLTQQIDSYYCCSHCAAMVKDAQFYVSKEEEKQRYLKHENDINDKRYQEFTSPITHFILENCKPNQLGLDFGCGTGPVITKCLRDKEYRVHLYDPYFYPDEDYQSYTYDYIFSCEVFEHFHHPKKEIENLVNLLNPEGYLLIMTHLYTNQTSFKDWYYRKDPTHVFIYTPQTMAYISAQFSLKLIEQTERFVAFKKQ